MSKCQATAAALSGLRDTDEDVVVSVRSKTQAMVGCKRPGKVRREDGLGDLTLGN